MLFQSTFDQFSYEEFYAFIRALMQKHKFWNIQFIPATNLQIFSNQQLIHAAPDHDISHPDSFIGQWKKNEDTVRRVSFRFTGRGASPDIEMTIDLDDRKISLDNAAGINPQEVKNVLHSSFSHVSDIELPKTEQRSKRNKPAHNSHGKARSHPKAGYRIFLVHGRDNQYLHETARFLEKLGPKVIILREKPNKGRTIIEKFEKYADVGYAVVLLTPDDRGGTAKTAYKNQKPRARQNVIFELGYFIARLGRDNVCALYRKGVELPSDYSGILYLELDEKGSWKLELARELTAADITVDMNKAL
jgi:predicted nucleotide-binding protein